MGFIIFAEIVVLDILTGVGHHNLEFGGNGRFESLTGVGHHNLEFGGKWSFSMNVGLDFRGKWSFLAF